MPSELEDDDRVLLEKVAGEPSWHRALRLGFFPCLSTPGLEALGRALAADDRRLLQGAVCTPPPLQCVRDWPVEAADAVAFAFWQGDAQGECSVAEAEEFFARCCHACDQTLGEPAGCRWFINWLDETPREEMIRLLLPAVKDELRRREKGASGSAG